VTRAPGPAERGRLLAELIGRHGVVGASAGIWHDGRSRTWSAGVASHQTGEAVRPATLFHLASVTKLFTATTILQLVSDGLIDLDQPISSLLPGLATVEAAGGGAMTIRSLLSHTSGIDGDFFLDSGPGDDALARFAAHAAAIPRPFGSGQVFSYGNAGYSLLGRVVETVTGGLWDRQLERRILSPLRMTRTTTRPEQALRWPFAVGHERTASGRVRAATGWPVPRSMGPAGVLCSTAADMLRFGSAFVEPATGRPGSRILPASLASQMQAVAVAQVYSAPADEWGLGWSLWRWGTAVVIGHDGSARGYQSHLRVIPRHRTAVVLLTNGGGDASALLGEIFGPLLHELCGVRMPPPWTPELRDPVPPGPSWRDLAGTYHCGTWRLRVADPGAPGARAELRPSGLAADELGAGPIGLDLRPTSDGRFAVSRLGAEGEYWPLDLVRLPDGRRLAHMWGRAAPRIHDPGPAGHAAGGPGQSAT
jgi:CubicO group peptidase (beta-lactamase class C family)